MRFASISLDFTVYARYQNFAILIKERQRAELSTLSRLHMWTGETKIILHY